MKRKIEKPLFIYFLLLFLFSVFYLYQKHLVGNDSTISEWLINYSGGFTKRGLIGQICIYLSEIFNLELRKSILFFQIFIVFIYHFILYNFLKNIVVNKILLLAIFTPIFILYPVAEIEVLARKETFIFVLYLFYTYDFTTSQKQFYKIVILPLAILIWEPVVFFLPFWVAIDLIENNFKKIEINFTKSIITYIPSIILSFIILFNPISDQNHLAMSNFLKNNYNEVCYMSCALLQSKSTIYSQFAGNFSKYSFEVFFRYFLIIIVGYGPLLILCNFSRLNNKDLFFFKLFNTLLGAILVMLTPIIFLFAMGYDWGRWVNIGYTFLIIFYIYLLKKKFIFTNYNLLEEKIILLKNKNFLYLNKIFNYKFFFTIFFIIYSLGWNPKTVISGDVGSFPGYRIPQKAIKSIYNKFNLPNPKNINLKKN